MGIPKLNRSGSLQSFSDDDAPKVANAGAGPSGVRQVRHDDRQNPFVLKPDPRLAVAGITGIDLENTVHIPLMQLRIGNEPVIRLVNVPPENEQESWRPRPVKPQPDAQTDGLNSREFLQFCSQDRARLLPVIRNFMGGEKALGSKILNAQQLDEMVSKLRLITSQARADRALALRFEALFMDGMVNCQDRTSYFIEQIYILAQCHAMGNHRGISPIQLYNFGIAHFKLELVQKEALSIGNRLGSDQSVHDMQNAEYYLQERLGLPTQHLSPLYANNGVITRQVAESIGDRVEAFVIANDGKNAIAYMSRWEPWVAYLQEHPEYKKDFAASTENYQKTLSAYSDERDEPGGALSEYPEEEYLNMINTIYQMQKENAAEVAGDLTDKFLRNHRADFLAQTNQLPAFFRDIH